MRIDILPAVTAIFIFEWLVRIVAICVVPRGRKPASATAWLMLIMLFPTIGLIAFKLIGNPKLPKARRAMQQTMDEIIGRAVEEARSNPRLRQFIHYDDVPQRIKPFVNLNTSLGGMPAFSGNNIELLADYDGSIERMIKDIGEAHDFVHIEFFIIALDDITEPLFEAMAAAVKRGVKVRVLFDVFGSKRMPDYKLMKHRLESIGAQWHAMLPFRLPGFGFTRPDLRNHRKIIVIDGRVGYTGSQNLVRRDYHRKDALYYDELMARVEGPISLQLHAAFISDWYSESGEILSRADYPEIKFTEKSAGNSLAQVLPSGPGYVNDNNLKLFTSLIHAARKRLVIVNPYFVPDESLMTALTSTAQRGVETVMINSEIMDQRMVGHAQRSYYEELLKAGVKIYWYKPPILLHSKHITIDDDIAVIGSSNLDMRSFQLDSEITLIVYNEELVSDLQLIESMYLKKSTLIKLNEWQKRRPLEKLFDNLARLTAALQ